MHAAKSADALTIVESNRFIWLKLPSHLRLGLHVAFGRQHSFDCIGGFGRLVYDLN